MENVYDRLSLRDFTVDFLGGLVPGILFSFLSVLTLGVPIWALSRELQKSAAPSTAALEQLSGFVESFSIELIIFFIVASYVMGHLFFRQDPKEPDKHSYFQTSKNFSEQEKKSWVVQMGEDGITDIQFPYLHLHEYLSIRGLDHLASMIPWKGKEADTHNRRSKTLINMLKMRLQFYFPEQCGQITRNEAHVRLMSSAWYITRALLKISVLAILITVAAFVVGYLNTGEIPAYLSLPAFSTLSVAFFALWVKKAIQKFIHYQRVREIIYVLETAFIASREQPRILEDL